MTVVISPSTHHKPPKPTSQPTTKEATAMAKTRSQAQGLVLSQRDRKRAAADSRAESEAAEEAQKLALKEEENQNQPRTMYPQEEFFQWLANFCKNYFTTNRFVQLSILVFTVNQAYMTFDDQYQSEDDINLLISTLCGIIALLAGVAIAFRVKSNLKNHVGDYEMPVPPWNTVYLLFLPIMLPYVYNKELMLYNAALASAVLELPWFAKIAIQTSLISSNTLHSDILANLKVVGLHTAIHYVLGAVTEFKSLDRVEVSLFSILLTDLYLIESTELYVILLQKLFISFALGIAVIYAIVKLWSTNTTLRTCVIIPAWVAAFVSSALYQLDPILGKNSIEWLFEYVTSSSSRTWILFSWLTSGALLIPTIFSYKIQLSPNFRRKIWHFFVLGLVSYPLHLDPEFVKLSLSGCLILFLVVEQTRYLKLAPFGESLDSHLRTFADFRDERGPVIFSYIYLFIGISLPILFNNSVIGLVVLGVGDSLASIVGSNWGEIHWSRSQKTVEGTLTFVLSTWLVCSLFKILGWFFEDKSYHTLLLTATLAGVLEGNSDMNDNVMIPGYMSVMIQCTP